MSNEIDDIFDRLQPIHGSVSISGLQGGLAMTVRLPDAQQWCVQDGLYTTRQIHHDERLGLQMFSRVRLTIDSFCPDCGTQTISISHALNNDALPPLGMSANRHKTFYFERRFECARDHAHVSIFHFRVYNDTCIKIGQYPTYGDHHRRNFNAYKKRFPEDAKELTTAVGLNSHDVGIGSFVYLRRCFERIIQRGAVKAGQKLDDPQFYTLRMEEKIELLKNSLPDFLPQSKTIYPILSKGIHELSEEACKSHFAAVLDTITMILDDELADLKKNDRRKTNVELLSKINQELQSTQKP